MGRVQVETSVAYERNKDAGGKTRVLSGSRRTARHFFSQRRFGVTYESGAAALLSKNVQLDTAFPCAANSNAPDFAWRLGLSVR